MRRNGKAKLNKSSVRRLVRAVGIGLAASSLTITMNAEMIATFENAESLDDWTVVNDTVMGGVSQSAFERTSEGNLRFYGQLSLENNGGFVSIRNQPAPLSLEDGSGIALRVKGDGRTYYLDLRSNRQRMAGSFRAPFSTVENEWTDLVIPFENFVAQSFGRQLPNVRLEPATITSIGFTLSDKKPGPFTLEVAYVKRIGTAATNESADAPLPIEALDPADRKRKLIELAIARGVPLFNEGNPAACAATYEVACTALLAMPDTSDTVAASLRSALKEIETTNDASRKAWILRYALDDARAEIASSPQ